MEKKIVQTEHRRIQTMPVCVYGGTMVARLTVMYTLAIFFVIVAHHLIIS